MAMAMIVVMAVVVVAGTAEKAGGECCAGLAQLARSC